MSVDPLDFLDTPKQAEATSDPLEFLGKDISRAQSLASAAVRGPIKGAASFSPLPNFGPISGKLGKRITEQLLPRREGGLEDILEFTGEHAPVAAFGEGGLVKKGLQALAGGLAKKGAKELNLPEWAQDIIGTAGMVGPEAIKAGLTKTLRPSTKQKSIVDYLKSKGFSDQEITPIIQDKKKLSLFSKGAEKFEQGNPWVQGIREKAGNIYEDIRTRGKEAGYLSGEDLLKFENNFYKVLDKLKRRHRKLINPEVEELFKNPIDFTEMHDFVEAVNDVIKGTTKGKAAVGLLKKPIRDAQKKMNPELYNELRMADNVYSRISNFSDKMTKRNWEGLVKIGQLGGAIAGVLTLNPALIAKGLAGGATVAASRYGLKKLLTSPRLQNIHLKMWDAVLKNNIPQAIKLLELFNKETEE